MSDSPDRPLSRPQLHNRGAHRHARCARCDDRLGTLGAEVIASRLRALGHPLRIRLLRALDHHQASVEQLAGELRIEEGVVRSHVGLLYRAGIVARVDGAGPPVYRLADWPSVWLVDQLARRIGRARRPRQRPGWRFGGGVGMPVTARRLLSVAAVVGVTGG